MMIATLDIATVQAFLLVTELQSFTRAAEALGTTQAGVSMKLQRLEALLGKKLVERSPRAVRLTAEGAVFLDSARALMQAHDRALSGQQPARQQLSLGISDHAAGPELVPLLERLHAVSPQLALAVTIDFSRKLLDAYDAGELDAVIVRQEAGRRGGEKLTEDEFGWFASPRIPVAARRKPAAGDAGAALRRARPRRSRARQGRHRLERGVRRRRRHRRGRRRPRRACGRAIGAADRAGGTGRHRAGARIAAARRLKGDAAFEGRRWRKTRRAADAGGDVSQCGRGWMKLTPLRWRDALRQYFATTTGIGLKW